MEDLFNWELLSEWEELIGKYENMGDDAPNLTEIDQDV